MKRFLLMMVVALSTLTASAQFYVGGDFQAWRSEEKAGVKNTTLTIAPGIGYELNEKWAIGGELKYSWQKDVCNMIEIAPYARWSYYHNELVKLFVDFGFGIAAKYPEHHSTQTGWNIGARPGIAIHLNKHFAILAKAGFVGYEEDFDETKGFGAKVNGEELTFGVEYTF